MDENKTCKIKLATLRNALPFQIDSIYKQEDCEIFTFFHFIFLHSDSHENLLILMILLV